MAVPVKVTRWQTTTAKANRAAMVSAREKVPASYRSNFYL
jgi:hypothetical protein